MILWYISKRMVRSPVVCIAVIVVASALTILLSWLDEMSLQQKMQLDAIYDESIIRCTVSDRQGNTDNLNINPLYIRFVTEEIDDIHAYIKDPWFKRTLPYEMEHNPDISGNLTGINCIEADMKLSPEYGTLITFAEGYTDELFTSSGDYVLIHKSIFDIMEYSMGDSMHLSILSTEKDFMIIGYYTGLVSSTIYAPWETIRGIAVETNSGNSLDSLSFAIANNRKLKQFKELASDYFLAVDIFAPPPTDFKESMMSSLTIHDDLFNSTLRITQKNIRMLNILTIVFYAISVTIGFLLCFVFTRNRKRELFLFRSIGMKNMKIMIIAGLEQLLLVMTGITVVCAVSSFWMKSLHFGKVGLLMACFMLGSLTSILFIMRSSLMNFKEE